MTAVATRCAHRQAEPVVLSTGETVASICIECFESLASDYVGNQRERAEREAFCNHDDTVELTAFGSLKREFHCVDCGAWL